MKRENKSARWHGLVGLAGVLLFSPGAHAQSGFSVAPANLNYLVENAQTIVRGNVVSTVVEPHPQLANLQTVVVTVAVSKTLKGPAEGTITFRQYVGNGKEQRGAGGYHKSEELLLFLKRPSLYGLTSPVAMDQGHFRVLRDKQGNRYAVNGRENIGLFSGVETKSQARGAVFSPEAKAMMSKRAGQVSLGVLEDAIQTLVAVQ